MTTQQKSSAPYSAKEEWLNTWTHGIGAIGGIASLILFIATTVESEQWLKLLTTTVYGLSLTCLMGASAIYHGATNVVKKARYKLFDHCAIYLLIAGTYTPLITHTIPSTMGFIVLGLVWAFAIAGIAVKLIFGSQYKKFSVMTYLAMGWLSLLVIYELIQALAPMGLALLGLGGVIYSSGVYFYLNHKIPYNHAIWHLFVLAAAICHFALIYFYVL